MTKRRKPPTHFFRFPDESKHVLSAAELQYKELIDSVHLLESDDSTARAEGHRLLQNAAALIVEGKMARLADYARERVSAAGATAKRSAKQAKIARIARDLHAAQFAIPDKPGARWAKRAQKILNSAVPEDWLRANREELRIEITKL